MYQPFTIQITQILPLTPNEPHVRHYHGTLRGVNIHVQIIHRKHKSNQYIIKEISNYPRINWDNPDSPPYQQDTEHLVLNTLTPPTPNHPLEQIHALNDISHYINHTLNALTNPVFVQRRNILIHILQELRNHTSELFLELRADKNPDGATHPYHYYLTDNTPGCIKNANDAIWAHMEEISDWINEYAIQYNPKYRDPQQPIANLRSAWIQQNDLSSIIENINYAIKDAPLLSQHEHINIIRQMREQHIPSLPKYLL